MKCEYTPPEGKTVEEMLGVSQPWAKSETWEEFKARHPWIVVDLAKPGGDRTIARNTRTGAYVRITSPTTMEPLTADERKRWLGAWEEEARNNWPKPAACSYKEWEGFVDKVYPENARRERK